ncbi:MAG: hypothetical protein M3R55_11175 [Acidobacteriota bacterium]|nr:hypothetical protein [Acidobacteriota bacterium]
MRALRAAIVLGLSAIATAETQPAPASGLALANFDTTVRPQDDLFSYANGAWLARAAMPDERVTVGVFTELAERAESDLRAVIEAAARTAGQRPGSSTQQVVDLYASLMDEQRLETLGAAPIAPELARIDAVNSASQLAFRCGYLASIATGGPFGGWASLDPANPSAAVVTVTQGGTLLPDRSYYLSADARHAGVREQYRAYLTRIFTLIGRRDPDADARGVLDLETALARAQLPQVEARDDDRTAGRFLIDDLPRRMPGFNWIEWGRPQGIVRGTTVVLAQPAFFARFAELVSEVPLPVWRAWLTARYVTAMAPFLSRAFVDARVAFFGAVLSGQTASIPQWRRAVSLVNGYLGDAAGKLYVEQRFRDGVKTRVEAIAGHLIDAQREAIGGAAWMAPRTREAALAKLSALRVSVGYPARWRDYRGLVIKPGDLVGNIDRARQFDHAHRMRRLRGMIDRREWTAPPQTVNAYYTPGLNEIIVPAAMLHAPLFQLDADDAVNYGGIGAVIGHELAHGFDQGGRSYDGRGAARDWWTRADEEAFLAEARRLVSQFSAFRPIDGIAIDGALTLGENVGDLGGLALAHRAYRLSLQGRTPPVIDGFTGDQRFFLGWAQVWRTKVRDEYLRQWLTWMPHAPPAYRANGPLSHVDAFYAAFDVKPGDRLFVAPASRARIW